MVINRVQPKEAGHAHPTSAAERVRRKSGGGGGGLYKPRTPIYPKLVHGRWRNIKWALLVATLAVYYVTPWIRFDRPGGAPDQAVLVDFAHGRFYFFWIQLWPQEVYFITGLLVMAALALFLTTAMFGRLWCGYACPQTVWTDLYIYIERLFEGDRNARMRLDAAPLSLNKLWRKGEESGHVQLVEGIFVDCDGDTILLKVKQLGDAACHTGHRSCFHRQVTPDGLKEVGVRVFDPAVVYKK